MYTSIEKKDQEKSFLLLSVVLEITFFHSLLRQSTLSPSQVSNLADILPLT